MVFNCEFDMAWPPFLRNWHYFHYALQAFQNIILNAVREGHGVFFAFWSFSIVKPLKNAIYPGNSMSRIHPHPLNSNRQDD